MLRFKEKEDIEARLSEVDRLVERWRECTRSVSERLRAELRWRLQISLVYHDAALEGDVLTYSEIKAAIDPTIISDTSLIPSYDSIKHYDEACQLAASFASSRRNRFKLDTVRDIFGVLSPEEGKAAPYRKENPLHRLYYHDIAPPEKIAYRMRKLGEYLDSNDFRDLHPVVGVAEMHHRLMAIFPWTKETGRVARIASNLLLQQSDYPLAIIHSTDRQRYYESLKNEAGDLVSVYLEAVETTAMSEMRVYEEAMSAPRRRHA